MTASHAYFNIPSMSNIHNHPHSRSTPRPHGARRRKAPPRQLNSILSFILGFALACVSILSFLGPSLLLRNFDLQNLSFATLVGSSLVGTSLEKETPGKYSDAKRIRKLETKVEAQIKNANKVKSCRRFEKRVINKSLEASVKKSCVFWIPENDL